MTPATMTLYECRDWLARESGVCTDSNGYRWLDESKHHPYPPTLDGAHAAMPEGVDWRRGMGGARGTKAHIIVWQAYTTNNRLVAMVPDTGHPATDLYRLAVAARVAAKKEQP